jgi:hypothetical protein
MVSALREVNGKRKMKEEKVEVRMEAFYSHTAQDFSILGC